MCWWASGREIVESLNLMACCLVLVSALHAVVATHAMWTQELDGLLSDVFVSGWWEALVEKSCKVFFEWLAFWLLFLLCMQLLQLM